MMMKFAPIIKEILKDIPKILWHATNYDNLGSIMHKGIIPNTLEKAIFFTDNPAASAKFMVVRGINHIISIPVETKHMDLSKIVESFDHNENFFKTRAWMYMGKIPPSKIKTSKIMVYNLT